MRHEHGSATRTPGLLKLAVIVQLFFLLIVVETLLRAPRSAAYAGLATLAVQALLLIAIWRMKRWAVIAYALLVLLGLVAFMVRGQPLTVGGATAFVLLRAAVLVPAVSYWKRMISGESQTLNPAVGR